MTAGRLSRARDSEAWGRYRSLVRDPQTLLILGITLTGMLGSVLAPALPGIANGLGVPDARVGLVITAYKVPSVLVIPVGAALADLYGRRTVLVPSLALFGAAGGAMYAAGSFPALLALALAMGVGGAAIFPLTVTLLGDHHDGPTNAAAQGLRVGVVGLGAIAVPAATGYLAEVTWNAPFALFLLALPVAALASLRLAETARAGGVGDDGETEDEESEADGEAAGGRVAGPGAALLSRFRGYGTAMRAELTDRNVAVLVAGGSVRGFVRYAMLTFVPLFAVRVLDASLLAAGSLLSLRGIGYVVVSPLAGLVVARTGRKAALAGALAVSGLTLAAIPFSPTVPALGAVVLAYTAGDALLDPVMKDTVTAVATPEYRAGVVNALYVCKRVAQTASPAAFGVVLALAGFEVLFALAGLVALAYLAAFGLAFSEPDPGAAAG